jgi:hypothetical protein
MRYIRKHMQGNAGWYAEHQPGEVSFWYDTGRWIYEAETDKVKLKRDVLAAFQHDFRNPSLKLTGKFPSYNIE